MTAIYRFATALSLSIIAASLAFLAYDRYEQRENVVTQPSPLLQAQQPQPLINPEPEPQSIGTGRAVEANGQDRAPTHLGGYLNNPRPPYPPELMEQGISGTVKLRVMVEADGKPSNVEVVSATHPEFGESARQTVLNHYTFIPAAHNGQPVRQSYTFTIRFTAP